MGHHGSSRRISISLTQSRLQKIPHQPRAVDDLEVVRGNAVQHGDATVVDKRDAGEVQRDGTLMLQEEEAFALKLLYPVRSDLAFYFQGHE